MQVSSELHGRGYRLGPRLGKGSYAKVKLAERFVDDRIVAIKIINKSKAAKEFVDKFLPREISVQLTIQHRNIIKIFEVIHQEDAVCVVMEYAPRGDLLDFVKRRGWLKEEVAAPMFYQVCAGLSYLHASRICHRDLKCENILLKHDFTAAISDFGFARTLDTQHTLSQTYCGSAAYASPELLRGRPYRPMGNDVWSLGCVLFIMITGQMPFYDKNTKKMLYRQLKGKVIYPGNVTVSGLCRDLVAHALQPNTDLRWKVDTIMTHPWLDLFNNLDTRRPQTDGEKNEVTNIHKTTPGTSNSQQESSDIPNPSQVPDKPAATSTTPTQEETTVNKGKPNIENTETNANNPSSNEDTDCNQHENKAQVLSCRDKSSERVPVCVKQDQPSSNVGSLLSLSSLNSEDDRMSSMSCTRSGVVDNLSLCRIQGRECVLQPGRPLSPIVDSETDHTYQSSSSSVDMCMSGTDTSTGTSTSTRMVVNKECPYLKDTRSDFKKSIQKILQSPLNVSNHPRSQDRRWQPKTDNRLAPSCRTDPHLDFNLTHQPVNDSERSSNYKSARSGSPYVNQLSPCNPSLINSIPGPSAENPSSQQTSRHLDHTNKIERRPEKNKEIPFRTNNPNSQSEFRKIPIRHKTSAERAQTEQAGQAGQAGLVSQLRRLFESKD